MAYVFLTNDLLVFIPKCVQEKLSVFGDAEDEQLPFFIVFGVGSGEDKVARCTVISLTLEERYISARFLITGSPSNHSNSQRRPRCFPYPSSIFSKTLGSGKSFLTCSTTSSGRRTSSIVFTLFTHVYNPISEAHPIYGCPAPDSDTESRG
jgi:hypothetical protein